MNRIVILLIWIGLPLMALAGSEPFARAKLTGPTEVSVGQKTTLVVDLVIEGYFSGAPSFDFPAVPGLLIIPSSFHPIVSTENIDGTDHTVQSHEIFLYPRRPGKIEIPATPVRLSFKRQPLDHDPVTATVRIPPLSFSVTSPPGTENIPNLIVSSDLKVEESWKPVPSRNAKTGDAFVRTLSWSASDVPGMIFPPLVSPEIDGLGVYPGDPEVNDDNSGGKRVDRVTYVCKTAGSFLIPEMVIRWWDPENKTVQQIILPSQSFVVTAPPQKPVPPTQRVEAFLKRNWISLFVAIALLASIIISLPYALPTWRKLIRRFLPRHLSPLNP